MTTCLMSPVMTEPDLVTLLDTITPIYAGTVCGGGVELPGSVDHVPPQFGGGSPRKLSSNPAKPFIASGGPPPLMRLIFAHWLLHHVTWLPSPASRSPMTKAAPFSLAKAKTSTEHAGVVVVLPPTSVIVVVTKKVPVEVYV